MLATVQENSITQAAKVEIPFAIAKLEEAARIIRQSISELPALRKRLERSMEVKSKARDIYGDMKNQHSRLLAAFDTAALSLLEAEQDDIAAYSVKLGQAVKSFNLRTPDYSKLCTTLNSYLSALPLANPLETEPVIGSDAADEGTVDARTTNNRIIGRLMNHVRMGYYPTCTDNLSHILRGMDLSEGVQINLLDPCCGCGLALRSLAQGIIENGIECKTYGVELDGHRAEEALTRIDRVGFGSFYQSRISNEAFHAMLLNPPYLSVMTEGGNNTRSERLFLVDSISNLMMGGLLIYIIPYYRLTADIARILCDNFSDISVWKFAGSEFKKFKQVAILGTRQKRMDASNITPELAALALCPESLSELSELPSCRYQLPAVSKEVALFKGALFNETELAEQLSGSKSFSRLIQRSGLDNATKRPLLPLSLGQIGLVGGSGLINGLVECETPHIIKGRIIKEKRARVEENTDGKGRTISSTLIETISNKLIFNILTPKGFISLTDYSGIGSFVDSNDAPSNDNNGLGHSASSETSDSVLDSVFPANDNSPASNSDFLFPLGRTVITQGARDVLSDYEVNKALYRHQTGDFGNVPKGDWGANTSAIKNGERIISSYVTVDDEKFWIITEHDRSVTTVLLPDEY